MRAIWLLAPLALVGCAAEQQDLMPLEIGNVWTYSLNTKESGESLQTLDVVGRAPVGRFSGYELRAESGRTRLAWSGDVLLASELAGTRFDPPLPLIGGDHKWSGVVAVAGEVLPAAARIVRRGGSYQLRGEEIETVELEHTFTIEGRPPLVVTTQYTPGIGILEQRHVLEGDLVLRMAYESGP